MFILKSKDFDESVVVTTLWFLSSNPGVSVVELCCFTIFDGKAFDDFDSSFACFSKDDAS